MRNDKLKVALVHDFLNQYGGAEKVLEALSEMFPTAPIYTLLYDKEKMHGKFADKVVHASYLQKFPQFLRRRPKWILPFFPAAPEAFDFREFDLVISSSGAWSKGIVTRLNVAHIAYVHSPMRFVWDENDEYLRQQEKGRAINFCARLLMNYIRIWDKEAAERPDYLIANSQYTQARIEKYYRRESTVIYPPVDVERISHIVDRGEHSKEGDTRYAMHDARPFLVVSRLAPYKKIDAVVEAFNKLGLPLVVIGEGPQEKYLRSIANQNVQILGWLPDAEVAQYYAQARAFVFAGVDDFGLAPVEAMAQGVPVLAIKKGGARETVTAGVTGEFFDAAVPEVIVDTVRRFMEQEEKYDRQYIVNRAREFSKERFIKELTGYIEAILKSKV